METPIVIFGGASPVPKWSGGWSSGSVVALLGQTSAACRSS